MKYLIAIDGGGTKTQVWCADEDGQILGEGQSGPASLAVMTPEASLENLKKAVYQSLQNLPVGSECIAGCMGLAGVDTDLEVIAAQAIFQPFFSELGTLTLKIVNDIEIAMAAATTKKNVVAVISGTGSHCFGKNAVGQTAKTSGYDFLLADERSGYSLGLRTLKAAVKSYDGRSPSSVIEKLVCDHFQVSTIPDLKMKVYHPTLTKTQIAELAKLTEVALNQGDQVAQGLFDELIIELVSMVKTVLERLELTTVPVECVLVGGMMRVPYVQENLRIKLQHRFSQLLILQASKPPVAGALRIALTQFL